jgi:hypothetical protein
MLIGIIPILDAMLIFKKIDGGIQSMSASVSHDDYWSETTLTGLNILLILLAHSNILFCVQASIRIHSLLNFRSLNGREEAAYLLSSVNKIFSSHTEQSEHYTYLLPLMKVIIDKSFDLLRINESPPNIPLDKETLATLDDFRQCISSINREDWEKFIEQITEPYADHYRSMSVRPFQMNMKIWWNHCQEMMNIGLHKRNLQIELEKSKFQVRTSSPRNKQN